MREPLSTGVPGLDQVLNGGLARNRVYLVEGDPGTGKTTLALSFLLEGSRHGERGVYITMSESRDELFAISHSHGWSLDALDIIEITPVEAALPENEYTVFHPEELELGETTKLILDKVAELNPQRLVLDSLAELRLLARDQRKYRRQVLALKYFLTGKQVTTLMLDDRTSLTPERQLHSIVHGVISLERISRDYGRNRRRLEVSKFRGTVFQEGFHDYNIDTGGLTVFPRLVASDHQDHFVRDLVGTSVAEFDELLGGGLDRGSTTLVMGPSGSGKTTLATKVVSNLVKKGEKVALFTFDEGAHSLLQRADSLGFGLRKGIDEGAIRLDQVDPAELSPGEFVSKVRASVEQDGVACIVIDSLNGYVAAMPEEQFLILQMHELLTYLNHRGIVTILILAQQGVLGQTPTVVDMSYLADTIILVRFFEASGEVRHAISVVKKRSSKHERTIREFRIGGVDGIEVGPPLRQFQGVLTGVPEYSGGGGSLLDEERSQ